MSAVEKTVTRSRTRASRCASHAVTELPDIRVGFNFDQHFRRN
jgi:hypothetical protein